MEISLLGWVWRGCERAHRGRRGQVLRTGRNRHRNWILFSDGQPQVRCMRAARLLRYAPPMNGIFNQLDGGTVPTAKRHVLSTFIQPTQPSDEESGCAVPAVQRVRCCPWERHRNESQSAKFCRFWVGKSSVFLPWSVRSGLEPRPGKRDGKTVAEPTKYFSHRQRIFVFWHLICNK